MPNKNELYKSIVTNNIYLRGEIAKKALQRGECPHCIDDGLERVSTFIVPSKWKSAFREYEVIDDKHIQIYLYGCETGCHSEKYVKCSSGIFIRFEKTKYGKSKIKCRRTKKLFKRIRRLVKAIK